MVWLEVSLIVWIEIVLVIRVGKIKGNLSIVILKNFCEIILLVIVFMYNVSVYIVIKMIIMYKK